MEAPEQHNKSRVVKIDSVQSWDFYFNQATNQGCPIVVHFTASWCIPSVTMNPYFEELASAFQDALFLTVDVDDVKGGTVVEKLVGANPEEIRKRIDAFVQSNRVYVA
ncbi:thioredoxin-like protein CXXS1 [Gossypium australe]|uniref:Thioredoxin-like protein CXXS1 n=1 Tax=Gossypium australe TaxID=47621 RepID=A0A5B6X494_9ROSI|nr:thioredoxin-like protein CXXS1 [Gossypium australe]